MLHLPNLSIIRNEHQEVTLLERLRQWIESGNEERTPGIHASDLLDPLQAFWKRMDPKPLTDRQVMLFTIGKVLHTIVLTVGLPEQLTMGSDAGTHIEADISYSPDGEWTGYPVELKTNRSPRDPREGEEQEDLHNYLEQLCTYMVLSNALTGYLWVLYISLKNVQNRTFPEIRCYTVTMTEADFYTLEQEVMATRDALQTALDARDPAGLPLCRDWLCGESCPWWGTSCTPAGRYGLPKKQWTV